MNILSAEVNDSPGNSRKPEIHLGPLDTRRRYFPKNQHYFTNRTHAVAGKLLPKPSRQFCAPKSQKLLSYIKYSDINSKRMMKDRFLQSVRFKDNPRTASMKDLSSRLFIKQPRDNVKAVVEIHPEFFSVVKGRPLRPKDDIKVYMSDIRSYAMFRQQIGYRNDIIIRLKTEKENELLQYEEIDRKIKSHLHNFQQFLTEDYKKACNKIKKTGYLMDELAAMNIKLLTGASVISRLNNNIYVLDSVRNVLKVYRRFLVYVAPLPWREEFDETLKDRTESLQYGSEGEFITEDDLVNSADIDKIVEVAKLEIKKLPPAYMYFKKPEEMISLLRTMELQSREYFMHLSTNKFPFILLCETMQQLKQATKQELDYFQYYIDHFKASIERELNNEICLKAMFFRILQNAFYDSVAGPEVLSLNLCIGYVYDQIFGACEEGHTNISQPMREIEVLYEKYSLYIDSLDFQIVNEACKNTFAQDIKKNLLALKAHKELRAFTEMRNSMKRAFAPPLKFRRVVPETMDEIKKRQKKLRFDLTHDKRKENKVSVTANEREALLTFTNWCEGTDPKVYLKQYYQYVQPVFDWKPSRPSQSDSNTTANNIL